MDSTSIRLSCNISDAKEGRIFVGGKCGNQVSFNKVLAQEFALRRTFGVFNSLQYLKAWYRLLVWLLNLISSFTFYFVLSWWLVLWKLLQNFHTKCNTRPPTLTAVFSCYILFDADRIDPDCYPKVHKWSFEWFYGFCWIFWGVAISIYLSAYTNIYLSFRDSTRIFQIEMFRGYLPILNGNLLSFIH